MIEDQADDLLNENQRRALSTRLAMLDRFFSDVEQLLTGDPLRGEMFEVINDLTQAQKKCVLSLLNEGRREIRVSRDQFDLEVKREYLHRIMSGHLSSSKTLALLSWKVLAASHRVWLQNLIRGSKACSA